MGIEVVVADLADGLPADLDAVCGVAGAVPRRLRPRARPPPGDRADPRARRAGRRRRRPARPDPAGEPGRARRRRRGRLLPALRRAAVLRRPARRLHGGARRARASPARPPGRRVGRRRPAARRTGWHCRPASSTSAATRRPPTSAPPRCCWPSWPRCTPSTTGPTGCARSRDAPTRSPPVLAGALAQAGFEVGARARSSTPSRSSCRAVPRRGRGRPREQGLHLRLVDADTVGLSLLRGQRAARRCVALHAAFERRRPTSTAASRLDALPAELRRDARDVPDPRGVLHPPQRDRRCCATCAGSRRATTRWTAG